MKTIKDLQQKWWYRLLKVIYGVSIIAYIPGSAYEIITVGSNTNSSTLEYILPILGYCLGGVVLFYLIPRCFYYVVLGSFWPEKGGTSEKH